MQLFEEGGKGAGKKEGGCRDGGKNQKKREGKNVDTSLSGQQVTSRGKGFLGRRGTISTIRGKEKIKKEGGNSGERYPLTETRRSIRLWRRRRGGEPPGKAKKLSPYLGGERVERKKKEQ